MWRRSVISHLKTLISSPSSPSSAIFKPSSCLSPRVVSSFRSFSSHAEVSKTKTRIEDVMPIATGHEREELEAELEGKDLLEINFPQGPFGTKYTLVSDELKEDSSASDALAVKERMNMMSSGFGWRKTSRTNVQCAHSTSSWKLSGLVEIPRVTTMTKKTNTTIDCSSHA